MSRALGRGGGGRNREEVMGGGEGREEVSEQNGAPSVGQRQRKGGVERTLDTFPPHALPSPQPSSRPQFLPFPFPRRTKEPLTADARDDRGDQGRVEATGEEDTVRDVGLWFQGGRVGGWAVCRDCSVGGLLPPITQSLNLS